MGYGAALVGLVGSATWIFQGNLCCLVFGVVIGTVSGPVFALR
jgi:hypothetical protein